MATLATYTLQAELKTSYYNYTGFRIVSAGDYFGDCFPASATFLSGSPLITAFYNQYTTALRFEVDGTFSNAGWHTIHIGSSTYTRSSASFSTSGGKTSWSWTGSNPFSAGSTYTITVTDNGTITGSGNYGLETFDASGSSVLTLDASTSFFKSQQSGSVAAYSSAYLSVTGLTKTDLLVNLTSSKYAVTIQGRGYTNPITIINSGGIPIAYNFLVVSQGD